ncbi:hypothetical protein ACH9EU_11665 [Kocuria sp. M1R5S2]|uniref:hypothetical protein n=1 Tax=Kocuria rhizosphaerae TaxID=3376285 RepID=UPI0037930E90
MSRTAKLVLLYLALLTALVVGIRLILGEWNWWLTGLGCLGLLATSLWSPRSPRDPGGNVT